MESSELLTPPKTAEPRPNSSPPPVLVIAEADARVLLEQSGWTLTPAHDRAKCEEELNLFLRLEADLMSPHGPLAQKMQEDILEALRAGGTIKIAGEDGPEQATAGGPQEKKDETQMMTMTKPKRGGGRPKGSKNKNPTAKKGPGRPKKGPGRPKKEGTQKEVDRFGSREGSSFAKLNSALSRKAKSLHDLLKEARIKPAVFEYEDGRTQQQLGGFYKHLKKLMSEGRVEKTEDGEYRLVK